MRITVKGPSAVLYSFVLFFVFDPTSSYALAIPTFQHIIVVVQENRTPDNLFGSNPTFESGVNIAPVSGAASWCLGACFNPGHGHDAWKNDYLPNWCNPNYVDNSDCPNSYCNGLIVTSPPSCPQQTYVDANDDNQVVAPYFDIANKCGFYDHVQPYEVLVNQPNTWGSGYVSGFRVPMLVVSAYTPAHYVSGSWSGQGSPPTTCPITTTPQYCHDFGSILAFIEYNFFGQTGIGTINPQYQFADGHAPDSAGGNIPLSDFFPSGSPQQFRSIAVPAGAPDANYFINYMGTPQDPDNDATDTD